MKSSRELMRRRLKDAYTVAQASNDTSTQNGAIILPKDNDTGLIGIGYNSVVGEATPERLMAPQKYLWTEHAERSAIYNMARQGQSSRGATMYAPWSACADCARGIIQAGITKLVRHKTIMDMTPDRWKDTIVVAEEMLREAHVEIFDYIGEIGYDTNLRFNGELWRP